MAGYVRDVITHWQPPSRLTYKWNVFTPEQAVSDYPESYLSFQLDPRAGIVLLRLNHFPVLQRFEKRNALGRQTVLDMLNTAIRNETVEPRSSYMKRNAARYEVDLENRVN